VSWMVNYDVRQARARLDFSNWSRESEASARYKIAHSGHRLRSESADVGDSLMPPASYLWFHSEAEMSPEDRDVLLDWASAHGIPLDVSSRRLRVWVPQIPGSEDFPYAVVAGDVTKDSNSELRGKVLGSLPTPVEVAEFDPQGCGLRPEDGVVVGLNRFAGKCEGDYTFSQGLLFVEGDVDIRASGFGVLVASGSVRLRTSENARLVVFSEGDVTLEGGDTKCRLAVVCGGKLTLRNARVKGSVLAGVLALENSTLEYDEDMGRGSIALGPARREILAYCDRDGEMAEDDRLMAVLYDNGVFLLSDPEYEESRVARGPGEALAVALELMNRDAAMDQNKWRRLGYSKKWEEAFKKLPGDQTRRAELQFDLRQWVETSPLD
jgi:heme-binding protein